MIIQVHVRVAYFGRVFETTETYPLGPEESLAPLGPKHRTNTGTLAVGFATARNLQTRGRFQGPGAGAGASNGSPQPRPSTPPSPHPPILVLSGL